MIQRFIMVLMLVFVTACSTAQPMPQPTAQMTVGMVLVGPINDGGWSQSHYDAMKHVADELKVNFVYVDKVNPADRPNVSVEQVIDELITKGATLIITNSDDFKDGTRASALAHPDIMFVHVSGDDQLTGKAPKNLSNLMGQMEYGKMIAGCAAALKSQTGKIGYVGPIINDETRRLVNAAYLGANYCWTAFHVSPEPLKFSVTWVGFWFNIPGVTLDPTMIIQEMVSAGNDVIISGIDTPDVATQVLKYNKEGKHVFSVPYDHPLACNTGGIACIGVPYFNWYPEYIKLIKANMDGTFKPEFNWFAPDWAHFEDMGVNGVGFARGPALANSVDLDSFINLLAQGPETFNLWAGPMEYQDGSNFITAGSKATTTQIWYQTQLIKGIDGTSK
jgi:simple sugar transport system substrate-binding protein